MEKMNEYLTVDKAAAYLGVSRRTMYNYLMKGLFKKYQPVRRIYISLTEITKYIESRTESRNQNYNK